MMRRNLTCYNNSNVSTSTENDSSLSTELDLLNPRRSQEFRSFLTRNIDPDSTPNLLERSLSVRSSPRSTNRQCVESKLPLVDSKERKKIIATREISNHQFASLLRDKRKYENKVTFAKGKRYYECDKKEEENKGKKVDDSKEDLEKLWRKEKSTPRIIRAVRRNSKKSYQGKEVKTESIERPNNSKSSVVVLYQGGPFETPESFSKKSDRASRSILPSSNISSETSPVRTKTIESPESPVPRYSIPRRKIASKRYSRISRRSEALNVNIYHKSKVMQVTPSTRNYWTPAERSKQQIYSTNSKDPVSIQEEVFSYQFEDYQRISGRSCESNYDPKEQSYPSDSLLMYQSVKKQDEKEDMKQSVLSPSLNFLMQHMQTRPKDNISDQVCLNTNEIDESKRVFPFQPTPSGNLKVIPNQVVFESKKVSVLVADPGHTKVNVKAELGKSNNDASKSISDFSTRQGFGIDLPPGVTPSAINHLRIHKKLPGIQTEYKPRTQPYKVKVHQPEMEQKQTTSQQIPSMHEVPLSSLGLMEEEPIDWGNVILPEKTDLYQELARRITNYKNADCIVRIGQDEFYCHLLVLQSYSTFFDERINKEIDLTESSVTSKAFSIIYDWMISQTSESCHLLRRDNILEIFTSAQYLGIKELEEQCWAFIDNDELFSENTAFFLYMEAKKINNTAVMELMVPRIMKFFLILVSTKDFLELSVDELCLLLKSNYICVNSEMEVLMSAVRWLMHDWENRKKHMLEVLKCVRFGLIAPWQLVDVKRNPENPEFIELMSYPEVQKMVDDGLAFVIIKYWYGNQTEDYYHWIDLLGLIEPTNRNWAGEDKNYVTYREFLLYLEEYQRTKISELKVRKQQTKPSLSNSLPKDYPQPNCHQSHCNHQTLTSGQGSCVLNNTGKTSKYPNTSKVSGCSYLSGESSTGIMMTPEMLTMYLNNLDRNNGKVNDQVQQDQERNNKQVNFDIKSNDDSKLQKRSCDSIKNDIEQSNYETQQRIRTNDTMNLRYYKQQDSLMKKQLRKSNKIRYSHEEATDSSKSEEDAATTIQAIYRGYKARRKYDEIKKISSEEKQNTKRVTELLSVSSGQKIYKPLEPLTVSMSHNSKENGIQQTPSPRKKERDGSNQPNISKKCFQDGDNAERCLSKSKEVHTGVCNYTRPLPRKLSNSLLGPNIDGCFLDNSLFYPDRESILIFGGVDPHEEYGNPGATGKDIYRFKPDENLWELVGEIPEPRHHHSVVYLKGRIYLVGGADPRENNFQRKSIIVGTVWSYDPTTRVWCSENDMLTPRKNFVLVVSHGKMYAIGGQDRNGIALRSAEAFDPSESTWREIQPMFTARVGAAGIKYRDFIWIAGGITKKELFSKKVECYDPIKNSWLRIKPLNSPRCFATLYVVSDCLYAIGGASTTENSTDSIDCIDIWNPHLCVWKEEAKMSIPRHGHCTASIGAQLLIIGGITTVFMKTLNNVECYCCEQGKWIKGVSPLPYAISGHSTVTLPPANFLVNS